MDLSEIRERLAKIRSIAGDDEYAHIEEKLLWELVLKAIAEGDFPDYLNGKYDYCRQMAKLALESRTIDFSRWFA